MSKKNKVQKAGNGRTFPENLLSVLVLAALFITPLWVIPGRLFPFNSPKGFFFMGMMEVVFFLWIYLSVRFEQYRLNRTQWALFAIPGVLVAWLTLSGIFASSPNLAFWASLSRGTGLIFFYHCLVLLIVTISLVKVRGQAYIHKLYTSTFIAGIIVALSTWIEGTSLLGSSGHGGLMGNSSYAGAYLLFSLFFGIYLFIRMHIGQKIFAGLGLVAIITSPVFISFAKHSIGTAEGATIAFLVGVWIISMIGMATYRTKPVRVAGWILIAGSMIGAVIIGGSFLMPSSKIHQAFVERKTDARFIFWDIAAKGVRERPMIGWGPENYSVVYHKYFNPAILSSENTSEVWVDKPHNTVLEMAVAGGIPAVILYVIFLSAGIALPAVLYRRREIGRAELGTWIGLITAVNLQNLIVFDTVTTYVATFAFYGIMIGKIQRKGESYKYIYPYRYSIYSIAGIGFVVSMIMFVHLPVAQARGLGDIYKNPTVIARGYPDRSPMGSATDFGGILDSALTRYQDDIVSIKSTPAKNEAVHTTITQFLDATDHLSIPASKDYRTWISAARLALFDITIRKDFNPSSLDRAKVYLDRAVMLSPDDPQNYWILGQWAVYSEKISLARDYFEHAITLNPRVLVSHQYMITLERQFGTKKDAEQSIARAKEFFPEETF